MFKFPSTILFLNAPPPPLSIAPAQARTIFVSGVTGSLGISEDDWEGFALGMGTSVKTWLQHYAPNRKRERTQAAVDLLANIRRRPQ